MSMKGRRRLRVEVMVGRVVRPLIRLLPDVYFEGVLPLDFAIQLSTSCGF